RAPGDRRDLCSRTRCLAVLCWLIVDRHDGSDSHQPDGDDPTERCRSLDRLCRNENPCRSESKDGCSRAGCQQSERPEYNDAYTKQLRVPASLTPDRHTDDDRYRSDPAEIGGCESDTDQTVACPRVRAIAEGSVSEHAS